MHYSGSIAIPVAGFDMISWIVLFLAAVVVAKSVAMVWAETSQTKKFQLDVLTKLFTRSTS